MLEATRPLLGRFGSRFLQHRRRIGVFELDEAEVLLARPQDDIRGKVSHQLEFDRNLLGDSLSDRRRNKEQVERGLANALSSPPPRCESVSNRGAQRSGRAPCETRPDRSRHPSALSTSPASGQSACRQDRVPCPEAEHALSATTDLSCRRSEDPYSCESIDPVCYAHDQLCVGMRSGPRPVNLKI